MKSCLIVNTKCPFDGFFAQEAIDVALSFSSFDTKVSLLFIDDGTWQLTKNINGERIAKKNYTYMFQTLDLYDINNIYVDKNALKNRNLLVDNLIIKPTLVDFLQIKDLIASHDLVLNF